MGKVKAHEWAWDGWNGEQISPPGTADSLFPSAFASAHVKPSPIHGAYRIRPLLEGREAKREEAVPRQGKSKGHDKSVGSVNRREGTQAFALHLGYDGECGKVVGEMAENAVGKSSRVGTGNRSRGSADNRCRMLTLGLAVGALLGGVWLWRGHAAGAMGRTYSAAGFGGFVGRVKPLPASTDPVLPVEAAYNAGHFGEAEHLAAIGKKQGIALRGVELTTPGLGEQKLPAVALIAPGHYVLVESVAKDHISVWDPDASGTGHSGQREFKVSEWEKIWTGMALVE
jgi:hypothetical protein